MCGGVRRRARRTLLTSKAGGLNALSGAPRREHLGGRRVSFFADDGRSRDRRGRYKFCSAIHVFIDHLPIRTA